MRYGTLTDSQDQILLDALGTELKQQRKAISDYAAAVPGQFDNGAGKNDPIMESLIARRKEIEALIRIIAEDEDAA